MAEQINNYQFQNTNRWDTRQLVTMALLCAISAALSFIETPPLISFLKFDASNMPAMVAGFAYGPTAGLSVGVIASIIHGIILGDFGGALMNSVVLACYLLPAALIYKRMHNWKGAIIGLIVGTLVATVGAILANLVLIPIYYGGGVESVIPMIVPILAPFNLIKGLLNSLLTLVVYKAISNLITPKKKQVSEKS